MRHKTWLVCLVALSAHLVALPAQAAPSCFGKSATIVGSAGNDVLRGTPRADVIHGLSGDDRIIGRAGNDRICAGQGEDLVRAGGGRDRVDAGTSSRATTIYGGGGPDLIYDRAGGGDSQNVYGGNGNDVIRAGDSNVGDLLVGGDGDDTILQGDGPSGITGGPGDDIMRAGSERDRRSGVDVLRFEAAPSAVVIDLSSGIATGWGRDEIDDFEWVYGSQGADAITGDGAPNVIAGLGGNDVLHGLGGADHLTGGGVNNTRFERPGTGDDRLEGGEGDDELLGRDGDDVYVGGAGRDRAVFRDATSPVSADLAAGTAVGEGSDTLAEIEELEGSGLPDTLLGDEGDNGLFGNGGAGEVLRGRGGDDVLGVRSSVDADGGEGSDTVNYEDYGYTEVTVDLALDSDSAGNTLTSIENLLPPLTARFVAYGDEGPNTIVGGNLDDQLHGRGGDDIMRGGGGDDDLDGGEGIDVLDGEEGTDTCVNGEEVRNCEA